MRRFIFRSRMIHWGLSTAGAQRATLSMRCLLIGMAILAVNARSADAELEPAERTQVLQLIREHHYAADDDAARKELRRQITQFGREAKELLRNQLEMELNPQVRRYESLFEQAAEAALRSRLSEVDQDQVRKLRRELNYAQKTADLDKATIKEKVDPALDELTDLLTLSLKDVLLHDDTLRQVREQIKEASADWQELTGQSVRDLLKPIDRSVLDRLPAFDDYNRRVLEHNAQVEGKIDEEEARAVRTLNLRRMLFGRRALAIDLRLCEAARGHSCEMHERKFFNHVSPVKGMETAWKRAKAAGTTAAGECIAVGLKDGSNAIKLWWHSPGHFKIITSYNTRIGVGRVDNRWTLLVGH